MTTLVIYPQDPTTAVFKAAYEGKGYTVINNPVASKSYLRKQIKEHDRIMMIGHGNQYGLFAGENQKRLLVDSNLVQLLRMKEENIFVWCYADKFVRKYKLTGFCTSMFISDGFEALQFHVPFTTETGERYRPLKKFKTT